MNAQQEFFAVFGELSVKFSNIEFMVGQILQQLVDPALPTVGGLLTDRMSLHQKIEHSKKLTRLRYCQRADMQQRVTDALARVDKYRLIRNAFIHGMWKVDPGDLAKGIVTCLDTNWSEKKKGIEWLAEKETVYTMADLRKTSEEIGQLVMEVIQLGNELEKVGHVSSSPAAKKTAP
jgi:hypothetical protein